jgi:hypothetical protein
MMARWGGRFFQAGLRAALIALFVAAPGLHATEVPESVTALVRSRISSVNTPDAASLARALGVAPPSKEAPPDTLISRLQDLGDLDGDGHSEYALVWTGRQQSAEEGNSMASAGLAWALFLVAWDGLHWQASPLMGGFEPFSVQVLPPMSAMQREIAVIVQAGATEVPFPAVFEYRAHRATLAWDGRSDESRYQGYDNGELEFRAEHGALQMVETGRADPGLLVFPKNGARGFEARTAYDWEHAAFIPVKTEYAAGADYTLYRFIAALHLRDFKTAYSLTDPAKLMKSKKPDLKAFRKYIEDQWPEFLDDKIFRARDSAPGDNAFTLSTKDKVFVYSPEFTGKSQILLSGLSRQAHKPEDE